jgi:hypothetical protein
MEPENWLSYTPLSLGLLARRISKPSWIADAVAHCMVPGHSA